MRKKISVWTQEIRRGLDLAQGSGQSDTPHPRDQAQQTVRGRLRVRGDGLEVGL